METRSTTHLYDGRALEAWKKYRRVLNMAEVARELGLVRSALAHWTVVPEEWLDAISRFTSIPQSVLRPDLFPPPEETAPWDGLSDP